MCRSGLQVRGRLLESVDRVPEVLQAHAELGLQLLVCDRRRDDPVHCGLRLLGRGQGLVDGGDGQGLEGRGARPRGQGRAELRDGDVLAYGGDVVGEEAAGGTGLGGGGGGERREEEGGEQCCVSSHRCRILRAANYSR